MIMIKMHFTITVLQMYLNVSIDRSNDLRSQTGLWSGEKFRNADVDRPVDEMEIENLDQYIVSATGCLAG